MILRFFRLHALMAMVVTLLMASVAVSCIEDGITTSPSHQPLFSTDTLRIGDIFTGESTPTHTVKVYNPHDKILSISSIGMASGSSGIFRINVDGQSGTRFDNVEIRPHDSIFIFVAATLPENGSWLPVEVKDKIEFVTNGIASQIVVTANGQDIERMHAVTVDTDLRWTAEHPRQIYDSLVVASGATLVLEAGARLYFHDKASLIVHGTLITEGTPEAPVELTGDRRGNVVTDISFDLMSRQWQGVRFTPSSDGNTLRHTEIRNTWTGVTVDSAAVTPSRPILSMVNCRLRNADGHVLQATHSWIAMVGCELAEAGAGPLAVTGGRLDMDHCTVSNYYLFSAIRGACVILGHINEKTDDRSGRPYLSATINNCIIYGSSADMTPGSLDNSDVFVRRSLLRSNGTDDDHFIDIIWNKDPLFYTVRADYIFDYRLQEGSPALEASISDYNACPQLMPETDFYGTPHTDTPAIGAYATRP